MLEEYGHDTVVLQRETSEADGGGFGNAALPPCDWLN
jgi:hypothetical protein